MKVEQFVMAYRIEQDRVRAMLPAGFVSLRPVLRINTEYRTDKGGQEVYVELNTPVGAEGKRGWLNIANWSSRNTDLRFVREGQRREIRAPFFSLTYTAAGVQGGCPAERDNDGCFYLPEEPRFRPAERITENKEFCDCAFAWHFRDGDAHGESTGETLPAIPEESAKDYPALPLTAENAAGIPCRQVLGAYFVGFERE